MFSAFYILEKACSRHSPASVHECAFTFTENVWQEYRPSSDNLFSLSSGKLSEYLMSNSVKHTNKRSLEKNNIICIVFKLELLSRNV